MSESKPRRSWKPTPLQRRASEAARRQADKEGACIPWPKLLKARREYVRWQAYYHWVRAIEEAEGKFPFWLAEKVDHHARGFLRFAAEYSFHHQDAAPPSTFWRMLQAWIDARILRKSSEEGWMCAVAYYAVKDLVSIRDYTYSEWCIESWKRHKPSSYPSFHMWCKDSEAAKDQILDQMEMRDDRRELIKLMRRVRPRAMELTITRYVEWEVFAYWVRVALEELRPLPAVAESEIRSRCPGFLELHGKLPTGPRIWKDLIAWIEDREFARVKENGWFEVLSYAVELHPRHQRTKDYWTDWEFDWTRRGRTVYPPLKVWSRELDAYTFEIED